MSKKFSEKWKEEREKKMRELLDDDDDDLSIGHGKEDK